MERRWECERTLGALGGFLTGLARVGAAGEIRRLVLAHAPERLEALGAARIAELRGWERTRQRWRQPAAGAAVQLIGWRLPREQSGQVFLELRRRRASALRAIAPGDTIWLAHVAISGAWQGEESRLRLRVNGALVELARFTRRSDEGHLAEEVEAAVRRIAGPAGARVESSACVAIWD